jgi:hypothetical protein
MYSRFGSTTSPSVSICRGNVTPSDQKRSWGRSWRADADGRQRGRGEWNGWREKMAAAQDALPQQGPPGRLSRGWKALTPLRPAPSV